MKRRASRPHWWLAAAVSWLLSAPTVLAGTASSGAQQVQVACSLLLHDLATAYSERDADRGAALFTPDGVWEVDGGVFSGTAQVRQRLTELPPTVMILLTTIDITPIDRTTARGVSYGLAFAANRRREDEKPTGTYEPIQMNGFTFVVEYRDTFKLTAAGWRIAKRVTKQVFAGPGQVKEANAPQQSAH